MKDHRIRLGLHFPAKPPISDLNLLARVARLIGIDTGMVWDHFHDFLPQELWQEHVTWLARDRPLSHEHYEWQVLLGYLASRTGNMRLGVGVTESVRRHPVMIAQALITLAHLTRRAPILGIGAGERQNTVPYGLSLKRSVGRLEEALQIIRMCFASTGTFDFAGEHFQLKNAVMDLQLPPGKTPPIWIAASGPRMLRLTGQYGDGWYPPAPESPEEYGDRFQTIRNHAQKAGRDPDRITGSMAATVALAPTDDDARALFKLPIMRALALYQSDHEWKRLGLTHPLGEGFRGYPDILPEEIERDQLFTAIEQVPDELLLATTFWGSPERVAKQLREYSKAGLQVVVVTTVSALASEKMFRYLPRALWSLRRQLA